MRLVGIIIIIIVFKRLVKLLGFLKGWVEFILKKLLLFFFSFLMILKWVIGFWVIYWVVFFRVVIWVGFVRVFGIFVIRRSIVFMREIGNKILVIDSIKFW